MKNSEPIYCYCTNDGSPYRGAYESPYQVGERVVWDETPLHDAMGHEVKYGRGPFTVVATKVASENTPPQVTIATPVGNFSCAYSWFKSEAK